MDAAEDGGGGNATTNSVRDSIQIGLATAFALPAGLLFLYSYDQTKGHTLSTASYCVNVTGINCNRGDL